jgi:hypothetical protein
MNHREDPVLQSSRREAIVVFIIWFAALVYSVGYCVAYGYNRSADEVSYLWGFPDWILWGVIAPWLACTMITIWFGYRFMSDESIGEDTDLVAGEIQHEANTEDGTGE